MKRSSIYALVVLVLALTFAISLATTAFAGGYRPFSDAVHELYIGAAGEADATHGLPGEGNLNQYDDDTDGPGPDQRHGPAGRRSPHGGFSDQPGLETNYCKTCHGVHLAGVPGFLPGTTEPRGDAWRLLRATSADDECFFCHEPAGGHTVLVQYTLQDRNTIAPANFGDDPVANGLAFGQHTIGATTIPDSNVWGPGGVGSGADTDNSSPLPGGAPLSCNMCHSVHGANTLINTPDAGVWQNKILRVDPAGNGGSAANGIQDVKVPDADHAGAYAGVPVDPDTVIIGFCGDCHNLNANWITTAGQPLDERLNPHTHPMNTNMNVIVNGVVTQVSNQNAMNCKSCHAAEPSASSAVGSNFPHQSVSHKLLFDGPTMPAPQSGYQPPQFTLDAGTDITDPQRQLPFMDKICLTCHGGLVGVTF